MPKPDYKVIWELEEELSIEHTVPSPPDALQVLLRALSAERSMLGWQLYRNDSADPMPF